jgi:regulator of replication initiation timing
MKEMEDYIKKIGELLNIVYKKISEVESKATSLEADVSRIKFDVETLKSENTTLGQNVLSKGEYEEFMNRLVNSLKGLVPETPKEDISQQ